MLQNTSLRVIQHTGWHTPLRVSHKFSYGWTAINAANKASPREAVTLSGKRESKPTHNIKKQAELRRLNVVINEFENFQLVLRKLFDFPLRCESPFNLFIHYLHKIKTKKQAI